MIDQPLLLDFVSGAAGIDCDGHPLQPEANAQAQGSPATLLVGAGSVRPLKIWRPSQFLDWTEPPGSHFLLPGYVSRGQLTTLIGQGGLGKSRLALWLAVCQILGRPWCGLTTGGDPQKWLFLGDENSVARLKEDLTRMFSGLTAEDISTVDDFLRLPAAVEVDDADVWLGDALTLARVGLTIEQEDPGVVVVDPLANFAPGDIAKPGEMKEAVRLILGIIRRAAPRAAVILLHHARTGRQAIVQGVGWDAANFGLGGKALFSAARCQINLMPGKAEDDTRLVLSCGKTNNCTKFSTRGLVLDTETFHYEVDTAFDPDVWLADVEGRNRSGASLCTLADVVAAVRDGHTTTGKLLRHLGDACAAGKRTAERLIEKAVRADGIKPVTRGIFSLGAKSEKLLAGRPI